MGAVIASPGKRANGVTMGSGLSFRIEYPGACIMSPPAATPGRRSSGATKTVAISSNFSAPSRTVFNGSVMPTVLWTIITFKLSHYQMV